MNLIEFLGTNLLVIIISLVFLYLLFFKPKGYTFMQFFNNSKKKELTFRNLVLGFVFGLVFGFIDNFGLMIGVDNFTRNLDLSPKIAAALGNTYSDFIGATAGIVVTTIISQIWKIDVNNIYNNSPIWITSVSIAIGCILGMFAGIIVVNIDKNLLNSSK